MLRPAVAILTILLASTAGAEPPKTAPPPADASLEGAFVSVRVVGGFTPYRLTTYEVLWRANVAVAGHYRQLVNYGEALHQMSLVPREEFVGLLRRLDALGIYSLPQRPKSSPTPAALRYEIEVSDGKRKVRIDVSEPASCDDERYATIIDLVRKAVIETAGDLAFRNVFFEPGTFGYVNLTSFPPARVYVDGRDTGRETPLYGYELSGGKHEVRIVAKEKGWERTHTLTVSPGMTTIVHFDLR